MASSSLHKNPSRKECENIIRRILMTEVLEKGTNEHFKTATDFLGYFQALYPASDSLTKQVQRAVKAMDLPKDERGYFIINKTEQQLAQDKELAFMLQKTAASVEDISTCETLFLAVEPTYRSYLLQLIEESATFEDKYVTVLESSRGLIFYTNSKQNLAVLIESLMKE